MNPNIPNRPALGQRPKRTKAPFGTARSNLRQNRKPRHIGTADYLRLIGAAKSIQGGRCIGHLAGITHECEDPFDAMHLIPQRTLVSKFGEGHESLTDERLCIFGCRTIHGSFDEWRGVLKTPAVRNDIRSNAHPDFETAVTEYGLENEANRIFDGA